MNEQWIYRIAVVGGFVAVVAFIVLIGWALSKKNDKSDFQL